MDKTDLYLISGGDYVFGDHQMSLQKVIVVHGWENVGDAVEKFSKVRGIPVHEVVVNSLGEPEDLSSFGLEECQ